MLGYLSGGTVDGLRVEHNLFAPSYIITGSQLDDIVDITAESLKAVLSVFNEKA